MGSESNESPDMALRLAARVLAENVISGHEHGTKDLARALLVLVDAIDSDAGYKVRVRAVRAAAKAGS